MEGPFLYIATEIHFAYRGECGEAGCESQRRFAKTASSLAFGPHLLTTLLRDFTFTLLPTGVFVNFFRWQILNFHHLPRISEKVIFFHQRYLL